MGEIWQELAFAFTLFRQSEESLTETDLHNEENQDEDLHVIDHVDYDSDEVACGFEQSQEVHELEPHGDTGYGVDCSDEVGFLVVSVSLS